jgi:hypothetical protein
MHGVLLSGLHTQQHLLMHCRTPFWTAYITASFDAWSTPFGTAYLTASFDARTAYLTASFDAQSTPFETAYLTASFDAQSTPFGTAYLTASFDARSTPFGTSYLTASLMHELLLSGLHTYSSFGTAYLLVLRDCLLTHVTYRQAIAANNLRRSSAGMHVTAAEPRRCQEKNRGFVLPWHLVNR